MSGDNDRGRQEFRERLASAFTDAGLPRMPSRVFAALFSVENGRLTAAELAEDLAVSPAAISGAVRYLTTVGMVGREREPGSRRDHYVVRDDVWRHMVSRPNNAYMTLERGLRDGAALLPSGHANDRVIEAADFLRFLQDELPRLIDRFYAERTASRERR